MLRSRCSSCVVVMAACAATAAASESTAPPRFAGGTAVVVLDVVVRDGRGRVARDLSASDFEVFEDGVKQSIESFQVVSRPGGSAVSLAPAATPATETTSAPAETAPAAAPERLTPALVTLVFDHLSPTTRAFALRAAQSYLTEAHRPGDVVGVFALDLTLRLVTPFTDDLASIRAGVERAVCLGQTAGDPELAREEARRRTEELVRTERQAEGLVTIAATAAMALGDAKNREDMAAREIEMEKTALDFNRERQGFSATRGLTALVRALGGVRGRKTLVLFSEGLVIPTSARGALQGVIDAANRTNVSFYTVDTGGLRAVSTIGEARAELKRAIELRSRQFLSGGTTAAESALSRAFEREENILRADPTSTLGPLARETGGLLISGTNDVRPGFRELADDMRFYYILSYSPRNDRADGRYRKLSVKVHGRGLEVRTRRGYLAPRRAVADGRS